MSSLFFQGFVLHENGHDCKEGGCKVTIIIREVAIIILLLGQLQLLFCYQGSCNYYVGTRVIVIFTVTRIVLIIILFLGQLQSLCCYQGSCNYFTVTIIVVILLYSYQGNCNYYAITRVVAIIIRILGLLQLLYCVCMGKGGGLNLKRELKNVI